MHTSEAGRDTVQAHYAVGDLEAKILGALIAAGKDPDQLSSEDLIPIDEFHVRGRLATAELARDLSLDSAMRILDVGCGLGGASRYLAKEYGCRVTGVDLNPEYCSVAAGLTRRLGLESQVMFRQGNAVALPFPDNSFDVVWTQHVAMNISDKAALYRELWRVLKPGGRLAQYDALAGTGGDVYFPVPWARDSFISFLSTPRGLQETLIATGFEILVWRDVTEISRNWFRRLGEKIRQQGVPVLGLHLLLGADFREMALNQVQNLEEDRVVMIQAVSRRPVTG